jgi:hypothetical protein
MIHAFSELLVRHRRALLLGDERLEQFDRALRCDLGQEERGFRAQLATRRTA